jgi:hypothetical protein
MKNILTSLLLFVLSFTTSAQLSGTYTIGPALTDSFACITCPGGLFDSLNVRGRSTSITALITGDLNIESGQVALQHDSTGFGLQISPSSAVLRTISYSGAGGILIDLNGADNLSIDGRFGGNGRYLRFVSAQNAQPVIQINNDAKNVIIRNAIIESANASKLSYSAGAIISRSFGQSGNDSLRILYNLIRPKDSLTVLREGIHITAPAQSGESLTGLIIEGNEFDAVQGIAINIEGEAGDIPDIQIQRNSIYTSRSIAGANDGDLTAALSVNSGSGHHLFGNFFGGSAARCGGGKADYNLGTNSDRLYMVWFGPGIKGNETIEIDSNVFDKISIQGSNGFATTISLLEIHPNVSGDVHIGGINGNFFGNPNASGATLNDARIFITERFNSNLNNFRAINCAAGGRVFIEKNNLGGILLEHNSPLGIECKLVSVNSASRVWILNNNFGGVPADNIVKRCAGDFSLLDLASRGTINGNTAAGIKAINFFSGTFRAYSVFTTGGSYFITNNTLGNSGNAASNPAISLSHSSSVPSTFYGFQIFGQGADTIAITGNQIGNIFSGTDSVDFKRAIKLVSVGTEVSRMVNISTNIIGTSTTVSILQYTDAPMQAVDVVQVNCPSVFIRQNQIGGFRTGSKFGSSFTGIRAQGKTGQNNSFIIEDNTIGDTTVNALIAATIFLNSKNQGTASTSDGIAVEEHNKHTIVRRNAIGGIYYLNTDAGAKNPFFAIRVGGAADSLIVTDNIIGSASTGNNILIEAQGDKSFLVFAAISDASIKNEISGNRLSNLAYRATWDSEITGIRTAFGATALSVNIENNAIADIKVGTGGAQTAFNGLWVENANARMIQNTINNVEVNSTRGLDQFTGVWLNSGGGSNAVSHNSISDITLSSTTGTTSLFTGYAVEGNGADISLIGNRLDKISILAAGDGSLFKGILLSDARTTQVHNNLVLYRQAINNNVAAFGIYDFSRTGVTEIYHNTIALFGTQSNTMGRYTAAYYKTNTANRSLKNNIFYNALEKGKGNYTVFAATNQGSFYCDFNAHYTEDHADSMMFYNDAIPMTQWRKEGFGKNSMHPPRGQYLVDSLTGKQRSFILNNRGETGLGVDTDIDGQSRPLESGPDLGAFELGSSSLADGLTSIEAYSHAEQILVAFPNPVKNGGVINFSRPVTGAITDVHGRIIARIAQQQHWEINTAPGIYFLNESSNTPVRISVY